MSFVYELILVLVLSENSRVCFARFSLFGYIFSLIHFVIDTILCGVTIKSKDINRSQ